MAVVKWTDQAITDIGQIAAYIALQSPRFASVQVERFFKKTEALETQVYLGRMVPETNKPYIRELILGNYRIIYRIVMDSEVHVLTVHHSAMRIRRSRLK